MAIGYSIVFVILTGWTWWILYSAPKVSDFLSYWAAAKLAVAGFPSLAYDIQAHRAVELTIAVPDGVLPFPYPPPFLLILLPAGLGPYWLGFAAWIGSTAFLYMLVSRSVAPFVYRMAHPQALANSLIGQNGFVTTSIFIVGTKMLQQRPLLGGAILGIMVIKPQLALLFPVALLAGREWHAIAGAAASSLGLLLLALLVFGADSYQGFFGILPFFTNAIAASGWSWNDLASPFAFARHVGVPQHFALIIHALIALAATFMVWRAWSKKSPTRVPILASATLLIPPYIFTYDALLLIVPMGWLLSRERRPRVIAIAWLCCFLPVITYADLYPGPNTIPIAALLCLMALHSAESEGVKLEDSDDAKAGPSVVTSNLTNPGHGGTL